MHRLSTVELFAWLPADRKRRPPSRDIVVALRIRDDGRELGFFGTVTSFGSPLDATVADLAIEGFYPADREMAKRLGSARALNARLLGLGASRPTDRRAYWRQTRGPFGPLGIYRFDNPGR